MALARPLGAKDHAGALALYRALVGDQTIDTTQAQFAALLDHPGTTLFGVTAQDTLCAMVTLHILPNITQGGRPYALIENVVTLPDRRGQGHARLALQAAIDAAWNADAYKIMLLTGQDAGARGFYERMGFKANEKFGMQLRRVPPRAP